VVSVGKMMGALTDKRVILPTVSTCTGLRDGWIDLRCRVNARNMLDKMLRFVQVERKDTTLQADYKIIYQLMIRTEPLQYRICHLVICHCMIECHCSPA
jgi:hypothetical protein